MYALNLQQEWVSMRKSFASRYYDVDVEPQTYTKNGSRSAYLLCFSFIRGRILNAYFGLGAEVWLVRLLIALSFVTAKCTTKKKV